MTIEELGKIPSRLDTLEELLKLVLKELEKKPTNTIDIVEISKAESITGISKTTLREAIKAGIITPYKPATSLQRGKTYVSIKDIFNNYFVKI